MAEIQVTGDTGLLDPEFKMEVHDLIGLETEGVKEGAALTKMESSEEEEEIRVKQEPEEEPIRTWDAQLEVFLKTIQSPCSKGETQQQPDLQVPLQITGMSKFVNPSKTKEEPMKIEDEDTGTENVLAGDVQPTEKEEQNPLLESTVEMEQLVTSVKIEDPFLPAQGVYKSEATTWNEGNEAKYDENWKLSSQNFDLIIKYEDLDVEKKRYKCWNCGQSFSSSSDLLIHERTHVGEKVYKCSQCGEYERTHKGQTPHRCSHCGNTFGRNPQDKTQVAEKPCAPSGCVERCSQRLDLLKHEDEIPCKCLVCGEIFRNDSDLKVHQRLHTGDRPYICLDCGKSFSRISHLISHEKIHTEVCSYCGKSFNQKTELAEHEKTHEAEHTFVCFVCGKVFCVSSELAAHVQTHKVKPFECSDCGKAFENSLQLTAHQKVHKVKKQHKCPHCGKSFTQRRSLNIHKKVHAGEKAHKCLMCGKNFTNSLNPKCHERTHTGRKLYKCSHCDRTFRWKSDLVLHELIHTEEKPFKCSDCGDCFNRRSSLLEHSRSHAGQSPFTCSYCGKMFTSNSVLLRHQKFHVAEEVCTCSQCGKTFKQQSGQIQEKVLKCPECTRSHDLSSDLACPQTHEEKKSI
ncbi:gastrula zinc finger protein XlCGF26.1 isoform X1 [Anolis carolinensis]